MTTVALTKEKIREIERNAKSYARKKGWGEFADDFAQQVLISFIECEKKDCLPMEGLFEKRFFDLLRRELGDNSNRSGRAKHASKFIALDAEIPDSTTLYHEIVAGNEPTAEQIFIERERNITEREKLTALCEKVRHALFVEKMGIKETTRSTGTTEAFVIEIYKQGRKERERKATEQKCKKYRSLVF